MKYNAFNRDLQLWVATCLHYGTSTLHPHAGPLSSDEELVMLRAGARFATTLQVPSRLAPAPRGVLGLLGGGPRPVHIDDRVGDYLPA